MSNQYKKNREKLGLSMRGLAAKVGCAPSTILRIEAETFEPKEKLKLKLWKELRLKR